MIMHEYETIYVLRSDLPEEESTRIHDRFQAIFDQNNGNILVRDDWGRRKLAYAIRKQGYGHYVYLNFTGPADLPIAIERYVSIEDNCIRFITVKLDENVETEERRVVAEERQRLRTQKMAAEALQAEAEQQQSQQL